jgi:hypothetical protein
VKSRGTQLGLSLLEVMLALAVATVMIMVSVRQIEVYELDNNVEIIKANIDNLFAAAAQYYRANCNSTLSVTAGSSLGVAISALIFTPNGYSSIPINNAGCLVKVSDATGGYVVQYNSIATNPTNTNCGWQDCSSSTTPVAPTQNALSSTLAVSFLQIQVSILLNNLKQVNYVKSVLGADCLSTVKAGSSPTTINTCVATTPSGATWLVFTRLPSYASPQTASAYWGMMPMLKEFNLQYTHDQMYELSGTYYDIGSPPATALEGSYVCGE